ncbi:MAG: hypothetical protein J6V30_01105 [Paludibacteraceae bacterium]|nr:hypothetical protein [Paludibacteraceae bacterium]
MKKFFLLPFLSFTLIVTAQNGNTTEKPEEVIPPTATATTDSLSKIQAIKISQTLAPPSNDSTIMKVEASAQDINDMMAALMTDDLLKKKGIKVSDKLPEAEKEIKALFDELLNKDTNDEERIKINQQIFEKMQATLRLSGSFFYQFNSLKNMGRIYSDDYNVRAYTWCCEMEDMSYKFYGFIQDLENDKVYRLEQRSDNPSLSFREVFVPSESDILAPYRWYGALYYKIINIKKGNEPKYILLGWSQLNPNLKMKVIDVLQLEEEKMQLGSAMFKGYNTRVPRGLATRIVFPYCANMNMSIVYNEKDKCFIFDHITPLSDENGNPLGCNGPDMSYDMLKKKGSKWVLKTDVDVKNKE